MSNKRITICDIAEELGVSCAIINRALNGKSGVSDELRKKILATAERLGYRANKVARSMARATITLGIVIPSSWQDYFSPLKDGISNELDLLLDYNVVGRYYTVKNSLSHADTADCIKQCIEDGVSGIVLCDVQPTGMEESFEILRSRGIPIVVIGDAEGVSEKCLTAIRTDARMSGRMAGEMLSLMTPEGSCVAAFLGSMTNLEHRDKAQGFTEEIIKSGRFVSGIFETLDDENIESKLISEIFPSDISGVYLATTGAAPIADMLRERGISVKIVATDTGSTVADGIIDGRIQCTIFQNPAEQGRRAVRALYEFLAEKTVPPEKIYIVPQPVLRSNLMEYSHLAPKNIQ
ncbi:MAG: LacI family DNA-binding transcriptional regulator [Clostridia bacterium]|nr:LacI family DNA-binding transcriptional regulator [Clostridia bacterium]